MPQEVLNILLGCLGTALTALVGWGVAVLTSWLNTKIKDKKIAALATKILGIIMDAVKQIYQEFVEILKKEGKFDKEAQKQAKDAALKVIKSQLTPDLVEFIKENYGDIEVWLSNQIEVALYNLKNCSK